MKQLMILAFAVMLGACSSGPFNKNINKGVDVDTVKLRGGSEVPEWFFDYPKDDEWVYGVATGYSHTVVIAPSTVTNAALCSYHRLQPDGRHGISNSHEYCTL